MPMNAIGKTHLYALFTSKKVPGCYSALSVLSMMTAPPATKHE